jgi:hypothetical protein
MELLLKPNFWKDQINPMNTLEKLIQSEKIFQNWLIASYGIHQKPGSVAKDFLNVGSPMDSDDKFVGFQYLFKRTVKTPTAFIGNYDAFANALIEFVIDNALALYGDSIRIAVESKKSLAIYKDCGGEIGGFWCGLKREGNIFTLSVCYQIYWGYNSILITPRNLRSCNATSIKESYAYRANRRLSFFFSKRVITFFIITLISASIALGLILSEVIGFMLLGGLIGLFAGLYAILCWDRFINGETNDERSSIEQEANIRPAYDLSPIHFPVKYFSHEKTAEAIAKNHDHQVFIERLQSILEKAVLAGEQSN